MYLGIVKRVCSIIFTLSLFLNHLVPLYAHDESASSNKVNKCNPEKSMANLTWSPLRERQCFSCKTTNKMHNGTEQERKSNGKVNCWANPPDSTTLELCGWMGDNDCMCMQKWGDLNDAGLEDEDVTEENGIQVERRCVTLDEIKIEYSLEREYVIQMGCERIFDDSKKEYEICFCEADQCNRDEKNFNGGNMYKSWDVLVILSIFGTIMLFCDLL